MDSVTSEGPNFTTFEPSEDSLLASAGAEPSAYKHWYIYILVWNYLPVLPCLIGNILPVIAFFRFHHLQTSTHVFICSQSVSDLLFGVCGQTYLLFTYTEWGLKLTTTQKYACLMVLSSASVSRVIGGINLLVLSTERLVAVVFTYQYYNWVTDKVVARVVAAVWIFGAIIFSLPLAGLNYWTPGVRCRSKYIYYKFYFIGIVQGLTCLSLLVLPIFNIVIACIAFKKCHSAPQPTTNNTTTQKAVTQTKVSYKITKMLLTVVGVFYLCWLPIIVLTVIGFYPPASWKLHGIPEYFRILQNLSEGLLGWSSAANPLIYAWKDPKYKVAFKRILGFEQGN